MECGTTLPTKKNKIAQGRLIPPETHTIVKRLAQLLCWSKVLTDIDVKCLLWQEARVSFADWDFSRDEGQPTILKKFQADGTYNGLAAHTQNPSGWRDPKTNVRILRDTGGNGGILAKLQIGLGICPRDNTQHQPTAALLYQQYSRVLGYYGMAGHWNQQGLAWVRHGSGIGLQAHSEPQRERS